MISFRAYLSGRGLFLAQAMNAPDVELTRRLGESRALDSEQLDGAEWKEEDFCFNGCTVRVRHAPKFSLHLSYVGFLCNCLLVIHIFTKKREKNM